MDSFQRCCLVVLALATTTVWAGNDTQPVSIFRSRPDLFVPVLTTITRNASLQAPGYYFVAPYQQAQDTVLIYDNDANLVYSGWGSAGPGTSHAPQTCQYKNETHLCFYQGNQLTGWGHGHGVIMNKHYQVVKSVQTANYQASSDMHEFKLSADGKTAILTQYIRSVYDLCDWGICRGLGYIQEGSFQEIDVESGELLFEWRSLDHIDPSESWVKPASTEISGSGEQADSPWDYFHINSVDKNADGDYLISARHVSAVYKISGQDGHVMWRLNGAKSDYHLDGFGFSSQHDARWISENENETVISLFDNASNGFNFTAPHTTGQIIKIDHVSKNATLLHSLDPPIVDGHMHQSRSQGNYQRLADGNVIMGWGNDAFWTEYSASGEVAFYGVLGWTNVMNYRTHKFNDWVGLPLTKPALWTYSKHGGKEDEMWFYMSWNGATEARQWYIYGSDSKSGPFELIEKRNKQGFETIYRSDHSFKYSYIEAVDKDSHVLGTSRVQQAYTPNLRMLEYCDEIACRFMPGPGEPEHDQLDAERQKQHEKEEEEKRLRVEAEEKEAARLAREAEEKRKLEEEIRRKEEERQHRQRVLVAGVFVVFLLVLVGAGLRGFGGGRPMINTRNKLMALMSQWNGNPPAWSPPYTKLKTEEDGDGLGYRGPP